MMSVFKRRRRRGGKLIVSKTYTGKYTVGDDSAEHRVALRVTDKGVALERLRGIVRKAERRRHGLEPSDQEVQRAGRLLTAVLAEYVSDLRARGCNAQYISDVNGRVGRLLNECGWGTLGDVSASSFVQWRGKQSKSAKTLNEYLAAMKGMLGFMGVEHGGNPLAKVRAVAVRGRETFERRALTEEECMRLLDSAGPRRVVYLAALLTGLRRGTLCALRWGHVHLDDGAPRIVVPAALMKNRYGHVAPLRDDLAAALRSIRPSGAADAVSVFGELLPRYGAGFLHDDLERAGVAVEDDLGRRVDFHALRHTAATLAASTGIHGHVLQGFTGHRTASQVQRYSHVGDGPVRALVEGMPRFEGKGTPIGTCGSVPERPNVSESVTGRSEGQSRKMLENQRKTSRNRRFHVRRRKATPTGFEPVLPG